MDKRGALYFKLVTGVFLLILAGYALDRLWSREPAYELYSTQICEVGDGMTVSGFVVRHESLLTRDKPVSFLWQEGQWVGGGQAVAAAEGNTLVIPKGGYVSHCADGYEGVLTPDFVLRCRGEELQTLLPRSLPDNVIGRLIHSQSWYFAAVGDYPMLKQGDRVRLSLADTECTAQILRTSGILLLECTAYLYTVTDLRRCEARLTTETLSAIALPARAVYYDRGQTYVYVLRGAQARRKAVALLRTEEDRVWIDPETLAEGEQVILTEIELSDGMVLK